METGKSKIKVKVSEGWRLPDDFLVLVLSHDKEKEREGEEDEGEREKRELSQLYL